MAEAVKDRVERLVDATSSAYSYDRYGEESWRGCIRMLISRGYNDREIEAILRSKWMRWAGDHASRESGVTSADLKRYLDNDRRSAFMAAGGPDVAELVSGTFTD